jgi:hypothetical protein
LRRIIERRQRKARRLPSAAIGDHVQVIDQHDRTETVTIHDRAATSRYIPTLMIAADQHSHVRACVQPRDGKHRCTRWGESRPVPVSLATPSAP